MLSNDARFRGGHEFTDQELTLRCILEHHTDYQQQVAVRLFLTSQQFIDIVHRESLCEIIELEDMPRKIASMLKAYYRPITARALAHNNLSQLSDIGSGVQPGRITSSLLFVCSTVCAVLIVSVNICVPNDLPQLCRRCLSANVNLCIITYRTKFL
uniref:Uncharacterized protein n=1 Tax=Schistocephalus solidus TaxID=70667 RepID=A0A0X3PIH9_SCHSO